jgi:hypothetical protein
MVKCWGYNAGGQLGIGSTTDQASPETVPGERREGRFLGTVLGLMKKVSQLHGCPSPYPALDTQNGLSAILVHLTKKGHSV